MNKLLKVKCPQCDTIFYYYQSEFRPFCTERCKMIDLGHWFEESYRVPEREKNPSDQNRNEIQEDEKDPENYEESYQEEDYNESDYE